MKQKELIRLFDETTSSFDDVTAVGGRVRSRVTDHAVVSYINIERPDDVAPFIHAPVARMLISHPERNNEWRRAVSLGVHVIEEQGMIRLLIGGNMLPDDDGVGGLWEAVDLDGQAGPMDAAFRRGTIGKVFLKERLPMGIKAIPEGQYKDVGAPADIPISLFSTHPRRAGSCRRMQRQLQLSLQQSVEQDIFQDVNVHAPKFWVTAPLQNVALLRHRRMEMSDDKVQTLEQLLTEVGHRAESCKWGIDGFNPSAGSLMAGVSGIVTDATSSAVVIQTAGGESTTVVPPVKELRQFLRDVTGVSLRVQMVPVVELGDEVEADQCVFGPVDRYIDANDLFAQPQKRDELLRVWAAVAAGRMHRGQRMLPLSYFIPSQTADVWLQVASTEGETPWSLRTQRVILAQHAAKALTASGAGFAIDGYSTSHRSNQIARGRQRKSTPKSKPSRNRDQRRGKGGKAAKARVSKPAAKPEAAEPKADGATATKA